MFFCEGKFYAKVWNVDKKEKYLDLRISTSEKGQDGVWRNSTWFARVIGHAFNSLKDTLKNGDDIVISKVKFTNEGEKGEDGAWKSYLKTVILDASIVEKKHNSSEASEDTNDNKDESPW